MRLILSLWLSAFIISFFRFGFNDFVSAKAAMPAEGITATKMVKKEAAYRANVNEGTVLHLWLRASQEGQTGAIYAEKLPSSDAKKDATASSPPEIIASTQGSDPQWFDYFEVALEFEGQIELSWSKASTNTSYIYAFEPETVLAEGIRQIYVSPIAALPEDLTTFHFRPPLGWTNDPNGFSRSNDGLYHLFYQHYPHTRMWWAMHWGHAVSKDLLHWIHQPIFLRPNKDEMSGGIFSGSAHATDGGLRIYYADHMDGRTPMEFQKSVLTKDLIRPMGPKVTAIAQRPSEIAAQTTQDFRDPNVFTGPGGQLFMLLGSKLANQIGGLVLLMRHNPKVAPEPKGWEYLGILHKETRWKIDAAECPGLLPLGNPQSKKTQWALIYGAQNSEEAETGRGYLSAIHLGTFDGKNFVSKSQKLIDFVAGSYGYQGYYDEKSGQSLLIGWLASWVDRILGVDFPTTFTVPRVLKLSGDKKNVLMTPHPDLIKLRGSELNSLWLKNLKSVELPTGTADIEVEFFNTRARSFSSCLGKKSCKTHDEVKNISLVLNHSKLGDGAIKIEISSAGIEVKLSWKKEPKYKFIAPDVHPSHLRVLIDRRSVELFADNGDAVGTTRIPSEEGYVHSVQFHGDKNAMKSAQIWSVNSTQQKAKEHLGKHI